MRRNLTLALVVGAALTVGVSVTSATMAYAMFCPFQSVSSFCPLPLTFELDGGVTPKALPKHKMAPVSVRLQGKISREDGSQPSALREVTMDFDKNGALNATGLPACKRSQLETRNTSAVQHVCRESIVGSGTAHVAITSSGQEPIPLPLTLFNGGVRDGTTTLFIRSSIATPTPAPLIATVKLRKIHAGRYGLGAISKIPPIAEGNGSLLDFSLKIKRLFTYKGKKQSYVSAKCPDGHFNANIISAKFDSGPTISGTVIRPCTSKD